MSSISQIPSRQNEIILVGDSVAAGVLAEAFASRGVTPAAYQLGDEAEPGLWSAIHVGNGEIAENAALIFGEDLAREIWALSTRNFKLASDLLARLGVDRYEHQLARFASTPRERSLLEASVARVPGASFWKDGPWLEQASRHFEGVLTEPGVSFERCALEERLGRRAKERGAPLMKADELVELRRSGTLEYRVAFSRGKEREERSASLVVIATESLPAPLAAVLKEKWIPVTLSSFTYPKGAGDPFSIALFNLAADFAIGCEHSLRLGSYRNLYMDKAVGVKTEADHATWRGVTAWFGAMGWIDPQQPFETHLCVESLSCDGIPLVGTLPELPGVYIVTGFAGRALNFLFAIAEHLADGIVLAKGFEPLARLSTRRFV